MFLKTTTGQCRLRPSRTNEDHEQAPGERLGVPHGSTPSASGTPFGLLESGGDNEVFTTQLRSAFRHGRKAVQRMSTTSRNALAVIISAVGNAGLWIVYYRKPADSLQLPIFQLFLIVIAVMVISMLTAQPIKKASPQKATPAQLGFLLILMSPLLSLVLILVLDMRSEQRPWNDTKIAYLALYQNALSQLKIEQGSEVGKWPTVKSIQTLHIKGKLVFFGHYLYPEETLAHWSSRGMSTFAKNARLLGLPIADTPKEAAVLVVVAGGWEPDRPSHNVAFTAIHLSTGRVVAAGSIEGRVVRRKHFVIPGPGSGVYDPHRIDYDPVECQTLLKAVAEATGLTER